MSYFCFIESEILSAPSMERLIAQTVEDARAEAEALLRNHASGYAAHVICDGRRVATVREDGRRSDSDVRLLERSDPLGANSPLRASAASNTLG